MLTNQNRVASHVSRAEIFFGLVHWWLNFSSRKAGHSLTGMSQMLADSSSNESFSHKRKQKPEKHLIEYLMRSGNDELIRCALLIEPQLSIISLWGENRLPNSQLSLPVVCWLLLVALDAEVVEVEVLLALAGVAGGPGLLGRLRSRGVRSSRCRTKSHDWLCEVWLHNIWVTKLATECLKFWGSPNPT